MKSKETISISPNLVKEAKVRNSGRQVTQRSHLEGAAASALLSCGIHPSVTRRGLWSLRIRILTALRGVCKYKQSVSNRARNHKQLVDCILTCCITTWVAVPTTFPAQSRPGVRLPWVLLGDNKLVLPHHHHLSREPQAVWVRILGLRLSVSKSHFQDFILKMQ